MKRLEYNNKRLNDFNKSLEGLQEINLIKDQKMVMTSING